MELAKWNRGGQWVDNDEGWHYRYCSRCSTTTEHGITEGCVPCGDAAAQQHTAVRTATATGSTGNYTVKLYPNGARYCSCKGFKFRKTCNHVKTVKF
jgi:hypothetical protein